MNSEGIGLGLTIVKQIVESLGGSIQAASAGINQGSTFTFCMKMDLAIESLSQDKSESDLPLDRISEEESNSVISSILRN